MGVWRRFSDERFEISEGTFSPDGRWVAYGANETVEGKSSCASTVNVISSGGRQISTDGGAEPVWCPCGNNFYRNGNRWMSVRIRWQSRAALGHTKACLRDGISSIRLVDLMTYPANGNRLLIVKHDTPDILNRVNLVVNWVELLRPTRGK